MKRCSLVKKLIDVSHPVELKGSKNPAAPNGGFVGMISTSPSIASMTIPSSFGNPTEMDDRVKPDETCVSALPQNAGPTGRLR